MKKGILYLILSAGSLALSAQVGGDLDLSFGQGGKALLDGHQTGMAVGQVVELLPDGDILTGGTAQGQLSTGFALTRFQANGEIDLSWGQYGKVVYMDPAGLVDMAVQNDGKIWVIGNTGLTIRRFLADGSPDLTFGKSGRMNLADDRLNGPELTRLALLPDGKILLGGEQSTVSGYNDIFLLQLNADGTPDTGFGDLGLVSIDVAYYDDLFDLEILPDGKIVAAGGVSEQNDHYDTWLVRFLPDGTPDYAFGAEGQVIMDLGSNGNDYPIDLVVQPDGKLVAGGTRSYQSLLVRFNANGSLDESFGHNGLSNVLDILPQTYIGALALRDDGRIVILGNYYDGSDNWVLAQTLPNGAVDTGFGSGGYYLSQTAAYNIIPFDIRINSSGSIFTLVSRQDLNWNTYEFRNSFLLEKFETTGAPDATFKSPGIDYQLGYPNGDDIFDKFVVQPDGKILGKRYGGTFEQLVRILPDGSPDPGFGLGGWASYVVPGYSRIYYSALALQPDGKIILAGYAINYDGDYRMLVLRFLPNGQIDKSFSGTGVYVSDELDEIPQAAGVQPDGNILIAGFINGDWFSPTQLLLIRLKPDGTPDYTFGTNGQVYFAINNQNTSTYELELMADGRILLCGVTSDADYRDIPFIARFQPSGVLDFSFGNQSGIATTELVGSGDLTPMDMALRPDGTILLAGTAGGGFTIGDSTIYVANGYFLLQYDAGGKLDTDFGEGGLVVGADPSTYQSIAGIALQPDGKILAAGGTRAYFQGEMSNWITWRFMPDGKPDPDWGTNGRLQTDLAYDPSLAISIFWLPEGKILVGGFASNNQDYDLAFARYWPGSVDAVAETPGFEPDFRVQSPVSEQSTAWYTLTETSAVRLSVWNADGKLVAVPIEQQTQTAGSYQVSIPLVGAPAGWYTLLLETEHGRIVSSVMKL